MMKVIRGISHWIDKFPNPVVAIGVFDGLHHGHRLLISKMKQRVKAIGGTPIIMTFDPHPVTVIHPERKIALIASLEYRLKLLEDEGVRACLVVSFTKRFSKMSPQRFIDHYLIKKLGVAEIVVGGDFYFGHNHRGNVALLEEIGVEKGFKVHKISVRKSNGRKEISSTRIRKFIADADIDHAKKLLDRPVTIMGRVIKGDRRGSGLGYPTANLDSSLVGFAPRGVYCVRIYYGKKILLGMANIGSRPSFKKDAPSNIEVHIFDFHQGFYGKKILVEFSKKIRDEIFFSTKDDLIKQIRSDEVIARKWFLKNRTQ